MPDYNEIKALKEKIKNQLGLVMSRVPENTRKEFLEFANGEFAGDYGMCLHYVWDCFKHYQQILNTQDTKLDYLITMVKNLPQSTPKPEGPKLPIMLGKPEIKAEGGSVTNEQTK
jgi:hypothetical protein